jgi:glycosyltransferase involved in cell wall biosynthesis
MSTPDVALISPYPAAGSPQAGRSGVATYAERLAGALADRGAEVAVLAPDEEGAPLRALDGRVRVRRPYARGARALLRAAAAARDTAAPVVHVQHETFLYGGPASIPALVPALRRLRRAGRGPVVTMHHVVDPSGIDADFTRVHRVGAPPALARLGLGAVQRAIGREAARVLVHEPGFRALVPGASVVPHGVQPVAPVDRAAARTSAGLGPDDGRLVVLCFGFLAPYKGLEVALQAAGVVHDRVHLVVAGGEHPRLAEAGDRYAETLRARYGAVATFTGYVDDAAVGDWFAAADVALLPYPRPHASSGPLALALGAGTPVLLSSPLARCAGAPEPLAVDAEPAALAARLRALADSPGALAELADASRALARDRAWPAVAERHLDVYEEVTHGRGASRGRVRAA